jgi:hypothetical protein
MINDQETRRHVVTSYTDAPTHTIAAGFILYPHGEYGFKIGSYDRTQPLVIDPIVVQATYLGGSRTDSITAMAVDQAGNIYLTGTTNSADFPATNTTGTTTSPAVDGLQASAYPSSGR